MGVAWMRASRLIRRGWVATVLLAVVIGLAGGVAIAATAAGRRTSGAFDRFLERSSPPELLANICPPDVEITQETLFECFFYDPAEEAATIGALREVESATRAFFRSATFPDPRGGSETGGLDVLVSPDVGFAAPTGQPVLLHGRMVDPDAPDEIVLNEAAWQATGLRLGARVELTFWSDDEVGSPTTGRPFTGTSLTVRVVGVVRTLGDLGAGDRTEAADQQRSFAGPGLMASTPEVMGFSAVLVDLRPGFEDAGAQAVRSALPDNEVNLSPATGADEIEPVREAIGYEANGAMAAGVLAGLATAVFTAQAVARQARREWRDLPVLRSMGVTARQALAAAGIRGLAIAAGAGAVAVPVVVALSPLGPVGTARRAETSPGLAVDGWVLVVGTALLVITVVAAATLPLLRSAAAHPGSTPVRKARPTAWAPPSINAGLDLAWRRASGGLPLGTAVLGVALALGVLVAAIGLRASLEDLQATPARFGAPWDLSVIGSLEGQESAIGEAIRDLPGVEAAAAITGTDVEIGGVVAWLHAFSPIDGVEEVIDLPIDDGRPPADATEIALGSTLLADLGLSIGDEVEVASTATGVSSRLRIVGTTMVNDNYERSPGHGGAVHPSWVDRYATEVTSDPHILQLAAGADLEAATATLEAETGGEVVPPLSQEAIRNVERIRGLPLLLAGIVGALALASLAHAAILSVRRSHLDLAVLRSLGFTRRQVVVAVTTHVLALVVVAAAVGLPLGVMLGRWGWRAVAEQIGVPDVAVLPLGPVALAVAAVLLAGSLAAVYPAWRAQRIRIAETLRTE